MHRLQSPQSMVNAACAEYFNGRMPANYDEWVIVFNFIAFNVAYGTEETVMPILSLIYPQSDISIREAVEIAIFQMQKKEEEAGHVQNIIRKKLREYKDFPDEKFQENARKWKPRNKGKE